MTAPQPVTDPPIGVDDAEAEARVLELLEQARADLLWVRCALTVAAQLTGVPR